MAPSSSNGVLHPSNTADWAGPEAKSGWILGLGIALAVAGVITIAIPLFMSILVDLFVGCALTIGGLVQLFQTFTVKRSVSFWMSGFLGAVALLCGLFLLAEPLHGIVALTIVVAAYFLADGICKLYWALQIRSWTPGGWIAISGAISLILGLVIWANLPGAALWVIGLLVGINMLISGVMMILMSMAIRQIEQQAQQGEPIDVQSQSH